jgi:hypothetical protein
MNHNALLQLVRVTCDHWHEYNAHTQRELLNSMFWLADVIVEDLKARPDQREYAHAISEIQLIQDFSETALEDMDLPTAFRRIADCALKAIPLPDDAL